ncbi:MAG: hypothetical protein ACOCWM_04050 [Cyclobacteriaceae bacterium]
MWRNWLLIFMLLPGIGYAQSNGNGLSIVNSIAFDKVNLNLTGTSGVCHIKPAIHDYILNVKKTNKFHLFETNLHHNIKDRVSHINFHLKEKEVDNLGKALSQKIFKSSSYKNNWYVYLSRHKPYNLNLNYPVGDAMVDLSGLPIENMKINTGNADVEIGYYSGIYNPVAMDTFMAHVEFGSLKVAHINMSKANTIIADVGFGSMQLDFSDICKNSSNIKASVGAGKLRINLPVHNVPVMVKINNSPLCRVNLPDEFTQTEKNVFVNTAYLKNPQPRLIFDVDVALGNIDFE